MLKKLVPLLSQIIASLFLTGLMVYAWTEPASPPPGGNVPAPLNVGSSFQTKEGGLFVKNPLIARQIQNLLGVIKLDDTKGVNISSNYSGSCCPGQHWYGESYNFSFGSIPRVFSLPGDNCQAFLNDSALGITSSGVYANNSNSPSALLFQCQNPVNRFLSTLILRATGLKFSAQGSESTGVFSGDSAAKVRSFYSEFPGDFSGKLLLPGTSCNVKVTASSVGGAPSAYDAYVGNQYSWQAVPLILETKLDSDTLYSLGRPDGDTGSSWTCTFASGKSGNYDALDNLMNNAALRPTSFTGDRTNISAGQKNLSITTRWLQKSTNIGSCWGCCTSINYSIVSTASGGSWGTAPTVPGVWYLAYAYDCQP